MSREEIFAALQTPQGSRYLIPPSIPRPVRQAGGIPPLPPAILPVPALMPAEGANAVRLRVSDPREGPWDPTSGFLSPWEPLREATSELSLGQRPREGAWHPTSPLGARECILPLAKSDTPDTPLDSGDGGGCTCLRCGWTWIPRVANPKRCPGCCSVKWKISRG